MGTPLLSPLAGTRATEQAQKEAHPVRSMLSGHCHSETHAATPTSAPEYHRRCAGAYAQPGGGLVICPCERHTGELRCRLCRHDHTDPGDYDMAGRQCADHDSCARRISGTRTRNPAVKEARAAVAQRASAPQCECGCGGVTKGGKFQPGHDAKLKSSLLRRAAGGDETAQEELRRRRWEKKQ